MNQPVDRRYNSPEGKDLLAPSGGGLPSRFDLGSGWGVFPSRLMLKVSSTFGVVFGLPSFATVLEIPNFNMKSVVFHPILLGSKTPTIATFLEEFDELVFGAFEDGFHWLSIQPKNPAIGKE